MYTRTSDVCLTLEAKDGAGIGKRFVQLVSERDRETLVMEARSMDRTDIANPDMGNGPIRRGIRKPKRQP